MKYAMKLFPVLLVLLSCRTADPGLSENSWYLTDEIRVELMAPGAQEESRTIQQFIQGRYGKEEYTILAVVQLETDSLFIQGLTPVGTSLFEISYDGEGIDFSGGPLFPRDTALYILADYQLCYYPAPELKAHLGRKGIRFEEVLRDSSWERNIYDGEEKIISITREGGTILFRNLLRDYSYDIEEADY